MKQILSLLLLGMLCAIGGSAQTLPVSTDAGSPLWYFIHTADHKVWTASGSDIVACDMITDTADVSLANQLWRFEGSTADGYIITNKAGDLQVCLMYNITAKKVALRLLKSEKFRFVYTPAGNGIQLISQTPASASYSSDVAICVDPTTGNRLIASTIAKAESFSLEPFIDHNLSISDEGTAYWYRISSCAEGLENHAITSTDDAADMPLPLLDTEITDERSQWMVTKGDNGLLQFTNRSTGSMIAASSVHNGSCNITQVAESKDDGGSFTAQFVGGTRYMLSAVEDDDVTRYLAATSQGNPAMAFPTEACNKTAVVWNFEIVESELTSLDGADATQISIEAHNGRIRVSGATEWHLYSLQGIELPRTTTLPEGIYIIQTPHKTIKVNLSK